MKHHKYHQIASNTIPNPITSHLSSLLGSCSHPNVVNLEASHRLDTDGSDSDPICPGLGPAFEPDQTSWCLNLNEHEWMSSDVFMIQNVSKWIEPVWIILNWCLSRDLNTCDCFNCSFGTFSKLHKNSESAFEFLQQLWFLSECLAPVCWLVAKPEEDPVPFVGSSASTLQSNESNESKSYLDDLGNFGHRKIARPCQMSRQVAYWHLELYLSNV